MVIGALDGVVLVPRVLDPLTAPFSLPCEHVNACVRLIRLSDAGTLGVLVVSWF